MRIPAYWSKATAQETGENGKTAEFTLWRSSDESPDAAHQSALAAAVESARRFLAGQRIGRYAYGSAPLREEVIQRFTDASGQEFAAVTRNHYGSLVLNSARVMFIDVDFPYVSSGKRLAARVGRFFGRKGPTIDEQREAGAREKFERFAAANAGSSVRLYRTKAGMRGMVTHELFEPAADATIALLNSIGSDPLFVRLCKAQECFRARLTPKHWRCGGRRLREPPRWPREADGAERFSKWLADYNARQASFATCQFLATLGSGSVHPEAEHVRRIHDEATRCDAPLPLA